MASKFGTCGEVHNYFSHHEADDAFRTYMAILADFENRNLRFMKNKRSAKTLRTLPPERGVSLYFTYRLRGLCCIQSRPVLRPSPGYPGDSITYHQERGDIAQWIEHTLKDQKLAEDIIGRRDKQVP